MIREMKGWSRKFEDPILLPDGRKLITLKHAADYIMKLQKLTMAAEGRADDASTRDVIARTWSIMS